MEIIISAIALAFVWVEILHIPYRFHQKLNFKPFNCTVCMSGWFAFIIMLLTDNSYTLIQMASFMSIAMIGQILLNGIINKL